MSRGRYAGRPQHRIACSSPVEVERYSPSAGRYNNQARMAVYDQGPNAPLVAVKEVLGPNGWVRMPGGDVCEILVSVVKEASNARIQAAVRAGLKGGEV